jgi:transaldolase
MKATQLLHEDGQSLWLDNITRDKLESGTLKRYIDDFSVTGLTSNPTIFDHAIRNSATYDSEIIEKLRDGKSGEAIFFELALEDLTRAADLFRSIYEKTNGVDGWVSLEVSPFLAYDRASTIAAAKELFARANRPNLFIKIPGTEQDLPAIEEAIFAGIPIIVTLLSSREQYLSAATRTCVESSGGLMPALIPRSPLWRRSLSVAGMWLLQAGVPGKLRDQLGIAMAERT